MWTCYENDVAYILLADEHPGEAAIKLVTVRPEQKALRRVGVDVEGRLLQTLDPDDNTDVAEASAGSDAPRASVADSVSSLILELDRDNRLIAIEIWGASQVLPQTFLEFASRETRPKPVRPR